jgi:hypothetical protein
MHCKAHDLSAEQIDDDSKIQPALIRPDIGDVAFAPEVLILMPCGFSLEQALAQTGEMKQYEGLRDIPAVVQDRVYVADANSYFARPGPRLVDGAELLSHLIVGSPWNVPADAYRKVNLLT